MHEHAVLFSQHKCRRRCRGYLERDNRTVFTRDTPNKTSRATTQKRVNIGTHAEMQAVMTQRNDKVTFGMTKK